MTTYPKREAVITVISSELMGVGRSDYRKKGKGRKRTHRF